MTKNKHFCDNNEMLCLEIISFVLFFVFNNIADFMEKNRNRIFVHYYSSTVDVLIMHGREFATT